MRSTAAFVLADPGTLPGDDGKVARMAILYDGQVKMAHLAIAAGYSVNGVARLHTEILKNEQLHDFTRCSRRSSTTRPTASRRDVS